MELTRRDVVAALAAGGVAAGGGAVLLSQQKGDDGEGPVGEAEIATLVAAAEVLYPSEVGNVEEFVTEYVRGRAADRPAHARGVADAVAYMDEYTNAWRDEAFAALEPSAREETLRRMNADTAEPVPDGSDAERVRYYVVNELLFALYTTPTGGKLVGIENPQGHPGGLTSYQQGHQS